MRLLILGSTGQVGGELVERADHDRRIAAVIAASRSDPDPARRADLRDAAALDRVLVAAEPSHVVLAAAATNVAWCEANPMEARRINVDGAAMVARACRRVGARLTFFSTDYVFDGEAGPYPESAVPHPINVYGSQKLEAESIVLAEDPANLVIRTCQVFGRDPRRRNYVLRVVDQLRAGETVEAAVDLYGTPTYVVDLVETVLDLGCSGATGLWHVAGESHVSRYQLARMIASAFELEEARVAETRAAVLDDGVNRPRVSGLTTVRTEVARSAMTPLETSLAMLAAMDRP